MKYLIKLSTYSQEAPLAILSTALQFKETLSYGTVVDIFAKGLAHKNGIFTSKKRANAVAESINKRGAFGGFGEYAVIAQVVAA